ncbi:MAG: hypothetical protein ABH864_01230 [archaeon]
MRIRDKLPSAFVLWHKGLVMVGVRGMFSGELGEIGALFGQEGFGVSQVVKQPERDFLAVFATEQPIVDFTVDLYGSGASAIVAWSLDVDRVVPLIERVVDSPSFSLDSVLDPGFARTLQSEFVMECAAYEMCEVASRQSGIGFDDLFATIRYGNFLYQYRGVPEEGALQLAGEKYGCSL